MKRLHFLFAALGLLATANLGWADEGFWLYSEPPRRQLKERYGFELTNTMLERLHQASVMMGSGGSGAFVSPDGLVLTNHHIGLRWLDQLCKVDKDYVRDGYYASSRDKELACVGLRLHVLQSIEDVTRRVHGAIKADMTLAQAHAARRRRLRSIEAESRSKTGLGSNVIALDHGGRYHLYRYKKYTDVRLVFAPESDIGSVFDVCFFRAYENGTPARTPHHIPWNPATPASGNLVFASGFPGVSDRNRTSDDVESLYGPLSFLHYQLTMRMKTALAEFIKSHPERERHVKYDQFLLDTNIQRLRTTMWWQEEFLGRVHRRERLRHLALQITDLEIAAQHQEALDRIAACLRKHAGLAKSYYFLESANAFHSELFLYARSLLRMVDESDKPDRERLSEYRSDSHERAKATYQPRAIVRELEIARLAESLRFWTRHDDGDGELVSQVLNGKTPEERARELVHGTHLDQADVCETLLKGGREAVVQSQDTMVVLARLVDARSRQVRRDCEEQFREPLLQAYAALRRIQQKAGIAPLYPDATGTLRLSFGKLLPYSKTSDVVPLGHIMAPGSAAKTPESWRRASSAFDPFAPLLVRTSNDTLPGNSGSPLVDRYGRLVGVIAGSGSKMRRLEYLEEDWGCAAIAAEGILDVLDKAYHADSLVTELGGSKRVGGEWRLPPPALPSSANGNLFAPKPAGPHAAQSSSGSTKATTFPASPQADKAVRAEIQAQQKPTPPPSGFSVSPIPSFDALVQPQKASPSERPKYPPRLIDRHKQLAPALVKAMKDPDEEVRRSAEAALRDLGTDAVPALLDALRAKDEPRAPRNAGGQAPATPSGDTSADSARLGDGSITTILQALASPNVEVRRRAARALARMVGVPRPAAITGPSRP